MPCISVKLIVNLLNILHLFCMSCFNKSLLVNLVSGEIKASDILLEALLEEDVARNAKGFFSEAQNFK